MPRRFVEGLLPDGDFAIFHEGLECTVCLFYPNDELNSPLNGA